MNRHWRLPALLRTPLGISGLAGVTVLVIVAVGAPLLLHSAASNVNVPHAQQGPSAAHWLGTDALGRDVLARILVATRLSLLLAIAATAVATVAGVLAGVLPVVLGRRLGRVAIAGIDFAVAFPALLLALFLIVIFGAGSGGAVLAVGIAGAPFLARLTHTLAAGISRRDFVAASRMLGVGRLRLLRRHVLPNIAEPILLDVAITIAANFQAFAALSFLGLGVQPPSYDWGQVLNDGLSHIYTNPAEALGAAAAIVLAGLSFSSLGEALSHAASRRTTLADSSSPPGTPTAGDVPAGPPVADAVLRVAGLHVRLRGPAGWIEPVRGVSFEVAPGESVGIVGESGSGKSLTALAVAGLLPAGAQTAAQRIEFCGRDIHPLSSAERRRLFGASLSMVFQDPMTALNPSMRVGKQLAEVLEVHNGATRRSAMARAVDRLALVRIPAAARRARQFPHEMSGGMRQRAIIGMGLMGSPRLIIVDEPTTALDVTVQRQILDLLEQIRENDGVAIVLISHDMGVIAQRCQRVLVMYAGWVVEELLAGELRQWPAHPYTRALLASVPDLTARPGEPLATISGQPPDPVALPAGCPFAPRCERADDRCHTQPPPVQQITRDGHKVACWYPYELPVATGSRPSLRETSGQ